jgi:hypothetical protein
MIPESYEIKRNQDDNWQRNGDNPSSGSLRILSIQRLSQQTLEILFRSILQHNKLVSQILILHYSAFYSEAAM